MARTRIPDDVAHAMEVVDLTDVVIAARLDYDYADFIGENDWLENIILRLIMDKKLNRKAFIAAVYEHDPTIFDDEGNEPYVVQIMLTFEYYLEHFEVAYQLVEKKKPRVIRVKKGAKPTVTGKGKAALAGLLSKSADFRTFWEAVGESVVAARKAVEVAFTGNTADEAAEALNDKFDISINGNQATRWATKLNAKTDGKKKKKKETKRKKADAATTTTTGSTGTYKPGEIDSDAVNASLKHNLAVVFRKLYGGAERSSETDTAMQAKMAEAFTGRSIVQAAEYITSHFGVTVDSGQAKKYAVMFGVDPKAAKAAGTTDDDDDTTAAGSTPADDSKSDLLSTPRPGTITAKVVAEIGSSKRLAIAKLKSAGSVPKLAAALNTDVTSSNLVYIFKSVYGIASSKKAIAGEYDDTDGSGGSGGGPSKLPAGEATGGMGLSAELEKNEAVDPAHVTPLLTLAADKGAATLANLFKVLDSDGTKPVDGANALYEIGVITSASPAVYLRYRQDCGC